VGILVAVPAHRDAITDAVVASGSLGMSVVCLPTATERPATTAGMMFAVLHGALAFAAGPTVRLLTNFLCKSHIGLLTKRKRRLTGWDESDSVSLFGAPRRRFRCVEPKGRCYQHRLFFWQSNLDDKNSFPFIKTAELRARLSQDDSAYSAAS
jgi:hypothetical protein